MSYYSDAPQIVVDNLSTIIAKDLLSLGNEQHFPTSDVDRSEAEMAEYKKRIMALRRMREEFENVVTGAFL